MNLKIIIIIILSLILYGCPARISNNIKNESNSTIFVLYNTGYESEISSGSSSNENYDFECIRIKKNSIVLEFKTVFPSNDNVEQGVFSSGIQMLYTQEDKLLILNLDDVSEHYELKVGC